jgi:hypothetical protein
MHKRRRHSDPQVTLSSRPSVAPTFAEKGFLVYVDRNLILDAVFFSQGFLEREAPGGGGVDVRRNDEEGGQRCNISKAQQQDRKRKRKNDKHTATSQMPASWYGA